MNLRPLLVSLRAGLFDELSPVELIPSYLSQVRYVGNPIMNLPALIQPGPLGL